MTEGLFCGHSLFGVSFEKFWDKVFGYLRDGQSIKRRDKIEDLLAEIFLESKF